MTEQRHKEAIQRLVEHPGNNECAECFMPKPSYCSLTLGIFLCPICAKFHQKCISRMSKVVPIVTHKWTKEEVDFLYTEGNKVVNAKYEKFLPIYYHRPMPEDPDILFEQWILAKYVREEFKVISQQSSYNQGSKTGALFKRAKDQDKFQRRKFILAEPGGKLQYYIKYSDKHPKDSIPMRNMVNVHMVPEKIGKDCGMQITYEKDGVRRNLYVFGEDGKNTTDWYHAIRASMARHKYKDFPDADVRRYLNTTIIREGWMFKTGPKRHEKFRKRWFSLVGTAIWYYANPMDAHPLGYIALGSKTFGYGVMRGFPKGIKEEGYGLTIHTPERIFVLNCENMDSRERWVENIEQVLASCTTVWTKPSIGKVGNEDKSVINIDDVPDLQEPSSTTVFTDLPTAEASSSPKSEVGVNGNSPSNSTSSEPRKPLFEKNTRSGQGRKDGKIATKASAEKKGKHGGTIKITNETPPSKSPILEQERFGSKRYSDDSYCTESDDERLVISPIHKQTQRLLDDAQVDRRRLLSSATDEDSDEEVVQLGKNGHDVHTSSTLLQVKIVKDHSDDGSAYSSGKDSSAKSGSLNNLLSLTGDEDSPRTRTNTGSSNPNRYSMPIVGDDNPPVSPLSDMRSKSPNSPRPRPRSHVSEGVSSGRSTPMKPPRKKLLQQDSDTSTSSDSDARMADTESVTSKHFTFTEETIAATLSSTMLSDPRLPPISPRSPKRTSTPASEEAAQSDIAPNNLLMTQTSNDSAEWRKHTFTSARRVQGKERKTLKRDKPNLSRAGSVRSIDMSTGTIQDTEPRPVDITIANYMETGIWFMLFQSESEPHDLDSYVTPWLGAEIAEMPASVGPIRLPSEFEIAVIDTAPGGYGVQRTTGPFYAEPGDVWEVEMPVDDGSAPDMFYHEGMETDDGSVMVCSNVENSKKFEVAVFKSGRKLFCRKNVRPGDAVGFKVQPALYVMPVDQDSYYQMEGEDTRASEIITKASKVELNFRIPKTKIMAKKRGNVIYFAR